MWPKIMRILMEKGSTYLKKGTHPEKDANQEDADAEWRVPRFTSPLNAKAEVEAYEKDLVKEITLMNPDVAKKYRQKLKKLKKQMLSETKNCEDRPLTQKEMDIWINMDILLREAQLTTGKEKDPERSERDIAFMRKLLDSRKSKT